MYTKIPRSALTDAALLACILGGANLFLWPSDPGWFGINPTPYFLLPILIGSRYGFAAGSVAGFAGCCIAFGMLVYTGQLPGIPAIKTHLVTFFALPLTGVLSAQLVDGMRRTISFLDEEKRTLETRSKILATDLELVRQSQYELQLLLLFQGAELCSLDIELRRLFSRPDADPLLHGLLDMLNRLSEVSGAALYRCAPNGRILQREAFTGDSSVFPETLARTAAAIAWSALQTGQLTTCRDPMTERQLPSQPYIAALPLTGPDGSATCVLLIYDMPFPAITWQNFARIELICTWVMTMVALKKDGPVFQTIDSLVSAKQFHRALALACTTASLYGLTSTLLIFTSATTLCELQQLVLPQLRSTDIASCRDQSGAGLFVLLPLTTQHRADELADTIRSQPCAHDQKVSCRTCSITPSCDLSALQMFIQEPASP